MTKLQNPFRVERIGGIPTLLQDQGSTSYQRSQHATMQEAKQAARDAWESWQEKHSSEYNQFGQ